MKELKNTEPAKIIDDVLFNLDKDVKDAMPNAESMKKNAQKTRRGKYPKKQKANLNLAEMELSEECVYLPNGDKFLAYDSGMDDPHRIIVFMTEHNATKLINCRRVFSDGTFKRPKNFAQVSALSRKLLSKFIYVNKLFVFKSLLTLLFCLLHFKQNFPAHNLNFH